MYRPLTLRLAVVALLIAAGAAPAHALTTFDEVKRDFRPSATLILDRSGQELQRLRIDHKVRRGQWVALADVSPALRTALVLSEDKRFYEHSGVDWQAVSAAAWGNLWHSKTRGASTLSMQLAGLIDDNLRGSNAGRSITQKIGQGVSAQLLETAWRKDQILEAYLNLVPFRGEMVGIDALSRTLFGKAANGLDAREAAVAVALVRAPNASAAQVARRACGVLKLMQAPARPAPGAAPARRTAPVTPAASVDCTALDMFASAALQRRDFEASEGIAPHLARRLVALERARRQPSASADAGQGAAVLRSTLRADLQRFAVQTLTQHLRELQGSHVEDGALVVLDNASGQVLAWVGSSGQLSAAAEVDSVLALRQPGSTLKPFLYAQAIAERRITAASLLEDSSSQIQTTNGLYIPQNYDHRFKGLVSARTALAASLNVPAVRTLVMVSPDAFQKQLRALGLPLKESGDYYGYSLALGSAEVSLLSLTNAYRTLANGGRFGEVEFALPAPAGRDRRSASTLAQASTPGALGRSAPGSASQPPPVLDPRAAFIVTNILSDPLARARTFGTDSILATRFWSAVKTGTSKDMRDNWAMGFSQRYTVGVWVGNASGAPMWDVSGTSGAAPVWAALMNYLHSREASRAPAPPPGLVQTPVQFAALGRSASDAAPLEAARSEWFIQGTEQAVFAANSGVLAPYQASAAERQRLKNGPQKAAAAPRITAPTSGTIIALDPDIPPHNQRLTFSAEGRGLRWNMDGKALGRGSTIEWLPWPGRHVVQLLDASGKVADEIRLEVRGAGVKAAGR